MCLDIDKVRYFGAQSLNILEFFQDNKIIYRDLKPENFVVEFETGHLKMVDFGFSKELKNGRAYTRCGTPEYMAPEVIN